MKINRLKEIFDSKNVKNRVLAKFLSKSESTISLWRNNKRQPSIEELRVIAQLLRVDIRDLLHPTTWENDKSETYEEFTAKQKKEK